jgi:GntR family transcriptional regulator
MTAETSSISQLYTLLRQEIGGDDENPTPLYKRLLTGLRRAVETETIGADQSLPSERDLASSLGVSRITVRRALRELVEEGLLTQKQGAGTFVNSRVEQPLTQLTGFTKDMAARGMNSHTEWLDRSIGNATPDEALALDLPPGAPISRLYRIRYADGKAMCLEFAVLPRDILPDPLVVEESLYNELDKSGNRPTHATQRLRAELIEIEHARLLGVVTGSACLYIERRTSLPDGRVVEFVRSHYRGDSFDFIAELKL